MSHDVVIVGGGIMGCSIAYHVIQTDPSMDVLVIERDPSYREASTVLSDGNVRVQFNLEENIRISQHTLEVYGTFAADMSTPTFTPDIQAKHQGNLFMTDEEGREAAMAGVTLQRSLGCDVAWLDSADVDRRFPPFTSAGLAGGTWSAKDGSTDPWSALMGYRHKARQLGVTFAEASASAVLEDGDRVVGVRSGVGDHRAETVVLAAGAWTTGLARSAGVHLPVLPVSRTVYVVASDVDTDGMPSVFLPSGMYLIPEHERTWLMSWSQPDDPIGETPKPVGRSRFDDLIWPELVEHFPAFDRLQVERSWAGLYAVNTLDGNAILGEWPMLGGLYLATGFSGHGYQQAPAVGRYTAELILGRDHQLDLSRLGGRRIIEREPLREHAGRIV